jgi:hypothetical protein
MYFLFHHWILLTAKTIKLNNPSELTEVLKKKGKIVVFKLGFNKPYFEGVYLNKNELFIWEYKVFHKDTRELTHMIAKEFRLNETVGPTVISDKDFYKEIEKILEKKIQKCMKSLLIKVLKIRALFYFFIGGEK